MRRTREFQGTISALEKSADATTHLYGVTIQVPSAYSSGLLSGMFADVTFYTDTQSDVVIVPTEAIQTGMDGQYVYTIDSDNIAHRIPVETGWWETVRRKSPLVFQEVRP